MALDGEYLYKTGTQNEKPAVGDYVMLTSGFFMRVEAGGLYSGPYKTADGIVFTLIA